MRLVFAWDDWNRKHVAKHGCNEADAKYVLLHAQAPFPREISDGKLLVWGQTAAGNHLEIVFALKVPEELEFSSLEFLDWAALIDYHGTVAIYIIHAMPMKQKQLRQYRRIWRST
jgi:uncharacterized DUF497 family protein